MQVANHCELCEHRLFDLSTGSTCGLTTLKPAFNEKCSTIKFGNNYINRIKEVNVDYYKIASTKYYNILHCILYLVIAGSVISAGYYLGATAWDKGVISTVPLIIIGIGVSIIPIAIGPLLNFRQKLVAVKDKKTKLDALLETYNVAYEIEIVVDEDVHGNKDYEVEINFTRQHPR
ncbi:hypothetical protein [Algoriphagus sp. NG3]|uniref:hypothetical protein n=1 Tax=Algoriphagus sp. NG3 TaxID=3097546 RepID=UPI002A83D059|nr:hypothetical protein [Algoriphagus sp. NG3]WPR74757.1 hypothetical protein SLW71_19000 [Algoriphagus sp. NG3]